MQLIKIDEVAKRLNVSISMVRGRVFANTIPYIKVGGSIRFDWTQIEKWLHKKASNSKEE